VKKQALVLLSGGLDSALSFVKAYNESSYVMAVTIDYGQKAKEREVNAAQKICKHYNAPHHVMASSFFSDMSEHPFFSEHIAPELKSDQLDDPETTLKSAKAVWVPNRNGIFINTAAAIAEKNNIDRIYVGFNAEEGATFPDNTQEFVSAINESLKYSTLNHVEVIAPTIKLNKTEIVKELYDLDFPFSLLWSCYGNKDKMCSHCESCQRLIRALKNNKLDTLIGDIFTQ